MGEENAGIDSDASDSGPRAADEPASEAKAGAGPSEARVPLPARVVASRLNLPRGSNLVSGG